MLNAAMVLMILAGIFGLPAAACSAACHGVMSEAAKSNAGLSGGAAFWSALQTLAIIASFGSIIIGSLVKRVGKMIGGVSALLFSAIFSILILQANILGLTSGMMLLIAAIMIFVAPNEQFRGGA